MGGGEDLFTCPEMGRNKGSISKVSSGITEAGKIKHLQLLLTVAVAPIINIRVTFTPVPSPATLTLLP